LKLRRGLLLFAAIIALCLTPGCNRIKDPIRIEGGLISGTSGADPSIRAYLGVPFAAPPVGDLRWREPQPVQSWQGVLSANTLPPACMQALPRVRLPWTEEFMHQGDISEDCLYLNVWTGARNKSEKRPVMVYIYGGGFSEGSNAVAVYNGEELAKKGVVLVDINYRVGPLGFLAYPELTAESEHHASGNYGLFDQVAALRWVRNNIAAFGGNPDRVTIFGQSAGAMSVSLLMQSPLAEGLFTNAIIQSGPGLLPPDILSGATPLKEGEQSGVRFAESKGAASLADLRSMPPEKLIAESGTVRMGPVTDGWFLASEHRIRAQAAVMNGFTADDLGAGGGFGPPASATISAYEKEARESYRDRADVFLSLYPADSEAGVSAMRKESARDRARVALFLWALNQAKTGERVYTYYFDRAIPWPEHPEFGAFHSGELPYVFDNLGQLHRQWEPVDRILAEQVSSYWVNFASTGDPNGAGLPLWVKFQKSVETTMRLGAQSGMMPVAAPEKVRFWTDILTAPVKTGALAYPKLSINPVDH